MLPPSGKSNSAKAGLKKVTVVTVMRVSSLMELMN